MILECEMIFDEMIGKYVCDWKTKQKERQLYNCGTW